MRHNILLPAKIQLLEQSTRAGVCAAPHQKTVLQLDFPLFERHGELLHTLLRYTQASITQVAQTAVCNRHHSNPFYPVYQQIVLTGDRRGAWGRAKRSQIDLPQAVLVVSADDYKSDRVHVVPLVAESVSIIKWVYASG